MESRNSNERSVWSTFLAITAALSVALLILVYAAGGPEWWLPLPHNIAEHGGAVDQLFYACVWITGITFVLVQAAMLAFLIQYRHRPGRRAVYSHGHKRLEAIWTITPTVILLIVIGYSIKVWADIRQNPPAKADVVIDVLAQQFQWNVRYPGVTNYGEKSQFGRTNPELYAPRTNIFGLEPSDPKGRDDVVTVNEIHVPKGKKVVVYLRSKDVLHSFFVPNLRVKMDAVPGNEGMVYFTATEAGDKFELICAELCGFQHYSMRARFVVDETVEEFEQWLRDNAPPGV